MKHLAVVTAVIALSTTAFAQTPLAKKSSGNLAPAIATTVLPTTNWVTSPIDPSITAFPPQFNGVDPDQVVAWAEKASASRGEFETSEAYQARTTNTRRQPITGSITPGDLMPFVYKIPEAFIKYDADAQSFTVSFTPSELRDGAKMLGNSYIVKARNEQSSYTGSNAYGVKTDISKIEVWSTTLLPAKTFGTGKIAADFAVPLDQAPAMKASLAIAYLARITDPKIVRTTSGSSPTRDNPRDFSFHVTALRAEIEQAVIFNQATGQIMARIRD